MPWNPSRRADWIQSTSSPSWFDCRHTARAPRLSAWRCTARFTSGSETRPYTAGSRVPRRLRLGPWRTRTADATRRAIGGREYTAAAVAPNTGHRALIMRRGSDRGVACGVRALVLRQSGGHDRVHPAGEVAGRLFHVEIGRRRDEWV